jgi:hypothetical protein
LIELQPNHKFDEIVSKQFDPNNDTGSRHFLEHFEPRQRSHVVNCFLEQIRMGKTQPERVISDIQKGIRDQNRRYLASGVLETVNRNNKFLDFLSAYKAEALSFVRWAIWWESLPREERSIFKAKRGEQYRRLYLESQPPTEKQISYLRSLGWTGEVKSKLHASELIEKLK